MGTVLTIAGRRGLALPDLAAAAAHLSADPRLELERPFALRERVPLRGGDTAPDRFADTVVAEGGSVSAAVIAALGYAFELDLSQLSEEERRAERERLALFVGVGIGRVEEPGSASEPGAGSAFGRAELALVEASRREWRSAAAGESEWAGLTDHALALVAGHIVDRSDKGWEVVLLRDAGLGSIEIAEQLGVSKQAVNKRLRAAGFRHEEKGRALVDELVALADPDLMVF